MNDYRATQRVNQAISAAGGSSSLTSPRTLPKQNEPCSRVYTFQPLEGQYPASPVRSASCSLISASLYLRQTAYMDGMSIGRARSAGPVLEWIDESEKKEKRPC